MSFILDALRKVERERHHGEAGQVSSSATAPVRAGSRVRWLAGMTAVALVSGVATAGILRLLAPAPPASEVRVSEQAPPEENVALSAAAPEGPPEPVERTPPPRVTGTRAASAPPPPPSPQEKPVQAEPVEAEPVDDAPVVGSEQRIRLVGHDSPARSSPGAGEPLPPDSVDEAADRPKLVLQGTSVINGEPVAVISDRRVFEGDHIDGAVVIRIGERVVELEFDGRRFTLTL